MFSLGSILGGLSLVVSVSVGAWLYQQKALLETGLRDIGGAVNRINNEVHTINVKVDDHIKATKKDLIAKMRAINAKFGRIEQLYNNLYNYIDGELAEIRTVLPEQPKPKRQPQVKVQAPRPAAPALRQTRRRAPEPDLLTGDDDLLQDEIDDVNAEDDE